MDNHLNWSRYFHFILLILFIQPLSGSSQEYVFDQYGTGDGLPQSKVIDMVQDDIGYLWIATPGGVSRFNGTSFENFTIDDGLAENQTNTLYLDSSGTIWIGHEYGKVSRYYEKAFHPIYIKDDPLTKKITKITEDGHGNIWFATEGSGALRFNKHDITGDTISDYSIYVGKEGLSDLVYSIQVFRDKVYFHIETGIKAWDAENDSFYYYKMPFHIPTYYITCFNVSDTTLLIGSGHSGLFIYNFKSEKLVNINSENGLPADDISAITYDRNGYIIGAAWGGGAFRMVDGEIQLFQLENGLEAKKIICILPDREGNIWFGSQANGLSYFKGTYFTWFSEKLMTGNAVWSIIQHEDHLFLGTDEGVCRLNLGNNAYEFEDVFVKDKNNTSYKQTMDIDIDVNKNLWIATWGSGVIHYNSKNGNNQIINTRNGLRNNNVSSILCRKNGDVWCGSNDGITIITPSTSKITYLSTFNGLPSDVIMALHEDRKENIWIGTDGEGVVCYLSAYQDSFIRFSNQKGIKIHSITENKNGDIWISTAGKGIYNFKNDSLYHYTELQGLPSNYVFFTVPDDNDFIWVGTSKNLTKFHPTKHQLLSLDQRDGFPKAAPKPNAGYADKYGNIWIGTSKGLLRFSPEQLPEISQKPAILMKGWRVYLKPHQLSPNIELKHNINHITFDFESIYFSNPEKVGVYYKLEGFENDWTFTKENFKTYDYLPPGEYKFLAKACASESCSDHVIEYPFVIKPPFWQQPSFYIIIIVVLISGFYLFIQYRTKQLQQRNKKLSDMVKLRTKELQQKNEEIIDSIQYAKNIQRSILSPEANLSKLLKKAFIYYLPKDIVSGDFYWMEEKNDIIFFASVDCTGHGVPGAFVSIVGHNGLARSVKEFDLEKPSEILDKLTELVEETLRHNTKTNIKDGMDIALCSVNKKKMILNYAGANNPLYFLRKTGQKVEVDNKKVLEPILSNDEYNLFEIKADKQPIGSFDNRKEFTNHTIKLLKDDAIYIFSDGYCDQFGGDRGKKFKYRPFKNLLLNMQNRKLTDQKEILNETLIKWQGDHEQVDDILVIGYKV